MIPRGPDGAGAGAIRWAIGRPVSIAVGVILVVMFGGLSIVGLPIQLTPDVTVPTISVATVWPGATPTEIEAEILEPQEEALKSLAGLDRMTSEARPGRATVNLELDVGASLDEALVRVSNLMSQVPDYPDNARQPVISTASASGPPLAVVVVQSRPPGREVAAYGTWVEETVLPRLERIRGVASIRFVGGRQREVHIDFETSALAARGLTIGELTRRVRAELADVSGGDIPIGKRRYVVRTRLLPDRPEQLESVVLATDADGTPVRLGDVARVRTGLRKPEAMGMVNGAPSMAMLFFREPGHNVLAVTEEIRATVDELNQTHLEAEGLEMRIVSDQTAYITGALDLVRQNLLIGGLLAMVVLLVFLRSFGASAVVAVSIPVSIIGTVLGMSLLGRTVNIVSLAGMAFAVGMVVDNSIVVLENIDAWRRRVPDVRLAALNGTREVWGAILASTLTTAAVFLPIIGWVDEVGELLRDVAVAISTAVFVSLVVSVMVIPSFSARILRARARRSTESGEPRPDRMGRTVRRIVASPALRLLVAAVGVAGPAWVTAHYLPSLEYLPRGNRNVVFGFVMPPPGYSVEEMHAIGQHIQSRLLAYTGVEKDGKPALARSFYVGSPGSAFMGAVAEDETRIGEVAALVREVQSEVPGVIAFANQASIFGRRAGGGRSIEIDIVGADLGQLTAIGGRMMAAIRKIIPGAKARPIPGLDAGAPEFQVRPRRDRAADLGISASELGLLLPLVLFPGAGSELYRGVGAVVLGGLALSTLLTLFVVPAVFRVLWIFRRTPAAGPEIG